MRSGKCCTEEIVCAHRLKTFRGNIGSRIYNASRLNTTQCTSSQIQIRTKLRQTENALERQFRWRHNVTWTNTKGSDGHHDKGQWSLFVRTHLHQVAGFRNCWWWYAGNLCHLSKFSSALLYPDGVFDLMLETRIWTVHNYVYWYNPQRGVFW